MISDLETRHLVARAALDQLGRELARAEAKLARASARNRDTTSKTRGRKTSAVAKHKIACEAVDRLRRAISLAKEMLEVRP